MNNKVVVDAFHTFMANDFSVCRVNFRGVGKSDGEFDNGQGELADAAAALESLCAAFSTSCASFNSEWACLSDASSACISAITPLEDARSLSSISRSEDISV